MKSTAKVRKLQGGKVFMVELGGAIRAEPGGIIAVGQGTPVNAAAAEGVLTFAGTVADGETATIGGHIYEFASDAAQTVIAGHRAVNIAAGTTPSKGTLTVDTQPTAGDKMVIGAKEYTFVAAGDEDVDGEISVGADLATAQAAIVAAINGTDGVNDPHPLVSAGAFAVNASVLTALAGGADGDLIATTETFTAGTNVFDAVTLGTTQAGADCAAADAVTALVAAITANAASVVTAADGALDTVEVAAKVKGAAGNLIAVATTCGNGSWGAGVNALAGGVDGTVALKGEMFADATYLYVASDDNTIHDTNWRRIALGAAY